MLLFAEKIPSEEEIIKGFQSWDLELPLLPNIVCVTLKILHLKIGAERKIRFLVRFIMLAFLSFHLFQYTTNEENEYCMHLLQSILESHNTYKEDGEEEEEPVNRGIWDKVVEDGMVDLSDIMANTIVDVKKNPPSLVPVYPEWDPGRLERWNLIKKAIDFLEE